MRQPGALVLHIDLSSRHSPQCVDQLHHSRLTAFMLYLAISEFFQVKCIPNLNLVWCFVQECASLGDHLGHGLLQLGALLHQVDDPLVQTLCCLLCEGLV